MCTHTYARRLEENTGCPNILPHSFKQELSKKLELGRWTPKSALSPLPPAHSTVLGLQVQEQPYPAFHMVLSICM